jgi:proline dehydrogenase
MSLNFEDTATAFALKSDADLERAYFLFRLIANQPLVRIGTAVTNFALDAHLPVEGLIRATVFDHFCGGTDEKDCMPIIQSMFEYGVSSILDYSVEGKEEEEQFDYALEKTLYVLNFVEELDAIPFAVFKPTAFGRIGLYEDVANGKLLSPDEVLEFKRVQQRFFKAGEKAAAQKVALLIDAEESWMQDTADGMVMDLMREYNKGAAYIYNTIQFYRHDRLEYLKKICKQARTEGFRIGIKAVRGAYMEKENERAEELGVQSPICSSKDATDENFNSGVRFMMENLDVFSIFCGSHNERSSLLLVEQMAEKGLANKDTLIWFGQLYGMSDHISFNLAKEGYNVAKYLPYGPVRDVMPYLIRRAEENTSVAGQTNRELELIKKERNRRKLG